MSFVTPDCLCPSPNTYLFDQMSYSLDSTAWNRHLDTQLTQGLMQLGGMNPVGVGSLYPSHDSKWAVEGRKQDQKRISPRQ